jgi:cation diffusion facilitator family transporter
MPQDEGHPYGHGKIETLSTLLMGGVVAVVGIGLTVDALIKLCGEPATTTPGMIALVAAALSVVVKEGLYQWTAFVARDCDSRLILSNAWHHRTDAISSVAALAGVFAARNGYPWADPAATLVVGGFIIKVGWGLGWPAFRDLTDATVGDELLKEIGAVVAAVPGVDGYHSVRARRAGADILVDVDIEVAPDLNVVQGHDVARAVATALRTGIKNVRDTMVHVEPVGARDGLYREQVRTRTAELAQELAAADPGVLGVHGVRIVPLEKGYLLNLDIEVSPELTVHQSHEIAHRIKEAVIEVEGVTDAVIHVDIHGEG